MFYLLKMQYITGTFYFTTQYCSPIIYTIKYAIHCPQKIYDNLFPLKKAEKQGKKATRNIQLCVNSGFR